MRLIFHGCLRDQFGPEVRMEAGSVAEAIEGFSRQTPWPEDLMVQVVGYDTEDKLRSYAYEVHVMPAMRGGGGKFGAILLGAAVIGIGVATGGIGLAAGHLVTTTLGASLLVSGGLMIAQGVLGLFLKSPTMKGVKDPEASKYLSVTKTTTGVGTPITLALGRINLTGHWLSLQSDSTNLSYGVFPAAPA